MVSLGIGLGVTKGGGAGFSPASIAGLALWSRAYGSPFEGTKDGGGLVSQWSDLSGNARHFLQVVGLNQPLWRANQLNSKATILFDGLLSQMDIASWGLAQPFTVFMLMRQVTWTDTDRFWDGSVVNTAIIRQRTTTPNIQLFAGSAVCDTTALVVNTWSVLGAVFNGASSLIRVNATEVTGNPGTTAPGGVTLGAEGGGTGLARANMEVAEVIVYNSALDAPSRAQVVSYLAGIGGI